MKIEYWKNSWENFAMVAEYIKAPLAFRVFQLLYSQEEIKGIRDEIISRLLKCADDILPHAPEGVGGFGVWTNHSKPAREVLEVHDEDILLLAILNKSLKWRDKKEAEIEKNSAFIKELLEDLKKGGTDHGSIRYDRYLAVYSSNTALVEKLTGLGESEKQDFKKNFEFKTVLS